MKYQMDLGFARINRNQPIDSDFRRVFSGAFEINKKLFGRKPKKFEIMICDTEKEFKEQAKYYYFKWGTATVLRDCKLVTRSPDFIGRLGHWKSSDFQNLMNHEMNHVFWTYFYGLTKPCWLLEGLACYMRENFILSKKELNKLIKRYDVDESILDYRYLERNFKNGVYPRYPVWASFTNFISKKYSSDKKLIKMMDKYIKNPKLSNYKKSFREEFKKSDKGLFREFLREL